MNHDPLVRGLAVTIIVVALFGVVGHALGFITAPQGGVGLTLAAASYLFGGWIGRNGH